MKTIACLISILSCIGCVGCTVPQFDPDAYVTREILNQTITSTVDVYLHKQQEKFEEAKILCEDTQKCLGKKTELTILSYGTYACVLSSNGSAVSCR